MNYLKEQVEKIIDEGTGRRRSIIQNLPMDKIRNAELRRLAAEDSDEPVSVLIELNLPQRRVTVSKVNQGGVTINVPTCVEPETLKEREQAERRIAEASSFLTELLGTSPRWLRSAGTFVARVTPEQLRTIAGSPMVKAIWLNRELRTSSQPV